MHGQKTIHTIRVCFYNLMGFLSSLRVVHMNECSHDKTGISQLSFFMVVVGNIKTNFVGKEYATILLIELSSHAPRYFEPDVK